MKLKELKEKNKDELEKLLAEKQAQIRKLRFDISSKQVKNNRELRQTRRLVAQILTLINAQ